MVPSVATTDNSNDLGIKNIVLNSLTLKIEKENAKAMIEGFKKDGKNLKTAIFTAQTKSWSIANNFRKYPKLITLKSSPPRKEYPLSEIGLRLAADNYNIEYKFIAVLDTIFHIDNKIELWQDLCNDDTFDIWQSEAPFNSLNKKEDPMILLLRVYEIDHAVPDDVVNLNSVYFGTLNTSYNAIIKKPVINNEDFLRIKNNIIAKISKHQSQTKLPEQINDTLAIQLNEELPRKNDYNVWWVNQGKTQEVEKSGKYIWAPIKQKDGNSKYYWDFLAYVKKDDIILSYSNGFIKYVCKVTASAIPSSRPQYSYQSNWEDEGRLVRADYYELNPPIPLNRFNKLISELNISQGPLDSNSEVKQGYLFRFTREGLKIIQESQKETIWPNILNNIPIPIDSRRWIFQANPEYYDLKSAITQLNEIKWKVSRYKNEIQIGDMVYLWEGGSTAGILAVGEITSKPHEDLKDDLEKLFIKQEDIIDISNIRVSVKITHKLVLPLLKEQMLKNPILANTQIIRAPIGSNFMVTPEESSELDKLIPLKMLENAMAPEYTIDDFIKESKFDRQIIENWQRRLLRKKHIVFQGPPGTGKTYVAQRLAKLVISNTEGFWDIVQFHPAYTYEDFIQGLRPLPSKEGLTYQLEEGRFLKFCKKAETVNGAPCVLIIDEINRANLAKVFGELMYLLEYRDQQIPLAAGSTFSIPENVYIIGTMNSADRSIALVDNAIRRRFSFIRLNPDYDVLKKYLDEFGYSTDSLITVLKEVNTSIDDPNYEIGISYFLKGTDKLKENLPDIWTCEIEPYLEEYFYDQPTKVNSFKWNSLAKEKLKEWR